MELKLSEHFTYKKLILYVLPCVAMMILTSVYSIVDGFFVSNYRRQECICSSKSDHACPDGRFFSGIYDRNRWQCIGSLLSWSEKS